MTDQPRAVALIPARSGSGRLPNKNIRPLFGHPLLAYAIAAARNASVFDKVLLSSDSEAYLRVGEHYGAEGIHRPPELASSTADLVGVFVAGEYEDGVPGNSTFQEGDWNGDGEFDSQDLVLAFQMGLYELEPVAVELQSAVVDWLFADE